MANVTEYITNEGERWDGIAYKAYGDPTAVEDIINANPDVAVTATLEAGIRLQIPIKETLAVETDTSLLPPWKR